MESLIQQHGSTCFARRPPPPPPHDPGGQNFTFSEHGHVAYRIKGNHKCSYMGSSVVECLTQDRGAAGSSVTAFCVLEQEH